MVKQTPKPTQQHATIDQRGLGLKSLFWLLGLGLVGLLIWWVGWEQIRAALSLADPRLLLLLCLLQVVTLLLCAGQIWYVLRCAGVMLPFSRVLAIYMAGNFIENVTPSLKFGGEAVKIYLLKQESAVEYQRLTGAFVTHKVLSMMPFVLFFTISALLINVQLSIHLLPYALGALLLLGGLGWWLLTGRRRTSPTAHESAKGIGKVLRFVAQSLAYARRTVNGRQMALLLLVSTGIWLLYPVKLILVAMSLGLRVPPMALAAALYTSYLVSMLPLAPGGLGSFEGSMVLLLGRLAVAPQAALALVLLLRVVTYWFPLLPTGCFAAHLLLQRVKPDARRLVAEPGHQRP